MGQRERRGTIAWIFLVLLFPIIISLSTMQMPISFTMSEDSGAIFSCFDSQFAWFDVLTLQSQLQGSIKNRIGVNDEWDSEESLSLCPGCGLCSWNFYWISVGFFAHRQFVFETGMWCIVSKLNKFFVQNMNLDARTNAFFTAFSSQNESSSLSAEIESSTDPAANSSADPQQSSKPGWLESTAPSADSSQATLAPKHCDAQSETATTCHEPIITKFSNSAITAIVLWE